MLDLVGRAATGQDEADALAPRLAAIAKGNFLSDGDVRRALVAGWEAVVNHLLDASALDTRNEKALLAFKDRFGLSQDELNQHGAFSRAVKAALLRDLLEGKLPDTAELSRSAPFNLQKDENLIYLFWNVRYLEDKSRTRYVGGSHGVSVRVMKGVYYRVGAFKGNPVRTTQRMQVDTGTLGVTNKHVYFCGPSKTFRVRHDKIVSFIPFGDGAGIVRDASTAKPQIFVTGDGWFTYNLLTNAARLSARN
jgi:hypothetical protein